MKLNTKRTILIGLAFLSISAFWQFYNDEIPKILQNTFHLKETASGVVMALDNVLAIFLLPFFGTLSDKVDTKIGKRMPFIVVGTILSIILLVLLITVGRSSGNVYLFLGILLLLLIAMGIYRSPAVSLMPDLTPAPFRSSANAIINLMGTVGAIYVLIMTKLILIEDKDNPANTNYIPFLISLVVFMAVAVFILFITIKEKKIKKDIHAEGGLKALADTYEAENVDSAKNTSIYEEGTVKKMMPKEVKRSLIFLLLSVFFWFTAHNAIETAISRFVSRVWGLENNAYSICLLVATIAATLSYVPIAFISNKIGRKKTILIGISIMALSYVACGLYPEFNKSIYAFFYHRNRMGRNQR